MKTALLLGLLTISSLAFARDEGPFVDWIRAPTESQMYSQISNRVNAINNNLVRTECSNRAKVYATEVEGLRYRYDANGNPHPYYLAVIKYLCR